MAPSKCLKFVVVGDGGIGKTSMLVTFATWTFPKDHIPTLYDTESVDAMVGAERFKMELRDTASQDMYDRLRRLTYPGTDVFLVCFSLASERSLRSVRDFWVQELLRHQPSAALILVGTQKDIRDGNPKSRPLYLRTDEEDTGGDRCVPTSVGKSAAFEIGASSYVECSALLREGIRDVFAAALSAFVDRTCEIRKSKCVRKNRATNRTLSVPMCCAC